MENEKSSCTRTLHEPSATGLSVLTDPEKPTLDIVFVHGFKGHPVRTWSHKTETVLKDRSDHYADSSERPAKIPRLSSATPHFKKKADCEHVYWPRHLIPTTLPTARVLVYGYDTNVRHSLGLPISKNTVYDIALDFLKSLEAERRSQPSRPLLFAAHSLGGIVVKEALRRSHSFESHHNHLRQIYESTAAIMFFGTPHGGADPRGLRELIAEKVVRAAGFTVNEQIVNTLLPTSERLRELRDEFAPMARQNNWIIYSFQEQYGVPLLNGKKVVEDVSSCLGDSSLEMAQHIASNHMDMCRFSGFHDVEYRKVIAALEHVQKRITEGSANSASPEISSVLGEGHRQNFIESLRYPAIDVRYATIKTAHTRTCRWLLKKPEYQDWLDINKTSDHHGFLWIRGKPGSGKSTLMKFAVANMRKAISETVVISFFFNARGEELEKSTLGMYQSLLFQTLKAIPDLQIALDCLRSTVPQGELYRWEKDDLQSLFADAIQSLGQHRLTCFIDALDECDEGQIRDLVAFLERLGQLAISSQIHFRVCLSSRHYPYISIRNGIQLTLEGQEGHVQDIAKYLNSELKAGRGKQFQAIKEEILKRSSGIFLWVALVVQILNKEYDHGRVHALWRRLREIPDGLDKLFEDILTRDRENIEELVLCLQWILYAKRPLKREEIYHAILSGTDPEALSVWNSEETTAQDMERFILSCSKGLAETTKLKAQTVQFIHESVRDFLLGKNGFNKLKLELGLGLSQDRLKQCCYKYMAIDTSEYLSPSMALPAASSEEAKGLRDLVSEKLPFLEYAVRNVLYHADVADGQGISQKAFVEEFTRGKWIMLDNLFEKYHVRRHTSTASLLYIVAEKNFSNLVRIQLESDSCPGTAGERLENERYATPLNAALANVTVNEKTIHALLIPIARTSHDYNELHNDQSNCEFERSRAAIKTIIEKRPNLNPRKGQTLIGWAASNGHEAVVSLLLARDNINPNSKDKDDQTPLSLAASNGHEAVVLLLLSKDNVDPNSKDKDGQTPLSLAASNGHEAVVYLLLSKDNVDPNSKDNNDQTPLSLAASNGHEAVVSLLLARDDINPVLKNNSGWTPLLLAASNGHEAVVLLLLSKDNVDPNSKDKDGQTPLSLAASNGREAVVRLLLSKDNIDPNSKDYNGQTPLSLAASNGREAVVHLLLSKDNVDPNSKDYGQTPLSLAASNGHEAVVSLLLARDDINPDLKNNRGWTPLSLAASNGHEAVVSLLLARGEVDPNFKDHSGQTPLLFAASNGHEAVVSLLLVRDDINPDLKNNRGWTPLSLAASNGHEAVVSLLLARGEVDPNFKDHSGQTPLLFAASNGHEAVVSLLLARDDIDPDLKDNSGWTPLSLAASNGHEAVVSLLLARGEVDLNSKDNSGRTPLLLAVGQECLLPVRRAVMTGSALMDYQMQLMLLEQQNKRRSLMARMGSNNESQEVVVKQLLARDDVDPNSKDNSGQTPLLLAASNGYESVVSLLLARDDIDPDLKNDSGQTPLSLAASNGHEAVVKLLHANVNDDPNYNDKCGQTPPVFSSHHA